MPISDALREWQNLYVVVAGAAAALTGLMFVAVSFGSHLVNSETADGIRTYVNPMLFHFVVVLVTACAMLFPRHNPTSLSIVLGLISLIGLWQVGGVLQRMRHQPLSEIRQDNHWLWHGLLPLLSYALGCAAAVGIAVTESPDWLNGSAVMTVTLLVCAIRNVWLLVLWIARQPQPD